MKISLVIRCLNEERHIGRLLDGVLQQTLKDVEIIIVDSGSTDETLSIVSGYPVKLLSIRPEEFSFGRSLNIGCQAASGDFIVIASAHVYPVYTDWLEQLVAPFANHKVALVYGKQQGDETTKYSEGRVLAKWFPDETNLQQDVPFCNNANAVIRQCLWEQLKYDEKLTGLEDTDWAKRVMQLEYQISYVADAGVVHLHNESPRRIYNRYRREAIAFKQIFPDERFGLWDFARLSVANMASDFRNAWHNRVFWRNLGSIFTFRLMQFWGTYRGFMQRSPVTSHLKRTFYYPDWGAASARTTREPEFRKRIKYSDPQGEHPVDRNSSTQR